MSLLLDALKKAAEQKAAKSRQDETSAGAAPQSAADVSPGREPAGGDAEDGSLPLRRGDDETALEVPEEPASPPPSEGEPRGEREDETLIFSVDDAAEIIDDGSPETPRGGDDTNLDLLAAEAGGIEVEEIDSQQSAVEEADPSQLIAAQAAAAGDQVDEQHAERPAGDETDLSLLIAEQAAVAGDGVDQQDAQQTAGDETDLSLLIAEQAAAIRNEVEATDAEQPAGDETDLSQMIAEQAAAVRNEVDAQDANWPAADETDLSLLAAAGDEAAEAIANALDDTAGDSDESNLQKLELSVQEDEELLPLDAEIDFEPLGLDEDPGPTGGLEAQDSVVVGGDPGAGLHGEDVTDADDEDMSLMLVEREPTEITSPRTTTSPQSPQDALRSLQSGAPSPEDLGLIDSTRQGFAADSATGDVTQTQNRTGRSDTATTGIATATATANLGAVPRPDPNAAQGHAPDNYDRTLMRLPTDEASRLFADITSGSDVVMTPDYAKRVFRSKSSAIRVQHAKIYVGIAVAILLSIGAYGVFEYQSESENIDANLRPLKNDPLPGALRTEVASTSSDPLVTESEVNQRALEILQSAEALIEQSNADEMPAATAEPDAAIALADGNNDSRVAAAEVPVEEPAQPAPPPAVTADPAAAVENTEVRQPVARIDTPQQLPANRVRPASVEPAASATASASGAATSGGPRLQIETGERLEEKQLLLRQAYDAFRSGDDALALRLYNRVLEIDPVNRSALLARAAIKVYGGNGAAAIEDYQALLLANPKDSLAMASLLAVANVSPLEAETQLKLMIRDEPDSPHLNFALANAYAAQDRWQQAQKHYFVALQNNPDDPNYAYNLAVSLEHISQPRAAVSYYRRALENYNKGLATFSRDAVGRRLEKLADS